MAEWAHTVAKLAYVPLSLIGEFEFGTSYRTNLVTLEDVELKVWKHNSTSGACSWEKPLEGQKTKIIVIYIYNGSFQQ